MKNYGLQEEDIKQPPSQTSHGFPYGLPPRIANVVMPDAATRLAEGIALLDLHIELTNPVLGGVTWGGTAAVLGYAAGASMMTTAAVAGIYITVLYRWKTWWETKFGDLSLIDIDCCR